MKRVVGSRKVQLSWKHKHSCLDRARKVGAIDLNRPGGSVNRRYLR